MRLGLVGCGDVAARGYGPASVRARGVEIVAVADPDRARRGLLARKLGASAHAHTSELLGAQALDGLVVCSPPEHHAEAALLAAGAGLTALVETPLALEPAAAVELALLASPPFAAFNRRFDQGAELARRVPTHGELELHIVMHHRGSSRRREDALHDLGPHAIDLALMLTGAVALGVRAHAERDRAGVALATSRGTVRIECATNRTFYEHVEIRDAAGRRIARTTRGGPVRGVASRVATAAHPLVRSLTAQLEAYGLALCGGHAGLLASAVEGAAVMCVLDAARRSDAVGGDPTPIEADRSRRAA